MQHPQFPADGRNRQVVPTKWWEQQRPQRQQTQPRLGRYEEQVPPPRQQLPDPPQRMQRLEYWNFGESHGEQFAPQPLSYRQLGGSSRGGRQVNPNPSESLVQQIVNVEQLPQNPRLLNVGPKPTKWAVNTPLSAFKTDLILHFRATELPKQTGGIASLAFLSDAYRTTFLSRLATERGLQADPELVAQEEITWSDFSRIMTEVFSQQVTDHEIRSEMESHTRPNSSGPDTIVFL